MYFSGIFTDGGSLAAGRLNVTKAGTGTFGMTGLNTFTGALQINAGTVQVTTLADIGVASGIGAGDTANNAGSLIFNGGVLQYTGSNATIFQATQTPSVSMNRLFSFASGATGNGTIDSSGQYGNNVLGAGTANSATLVFNNTGAIGFIGTASAHTLTLTGTSLGDNELDAQLSNNGSTINSVGVTKAGVSLWILGNTANSYTGLTTISAGQLRAQDGTSLPTASPLVLNGGVLEKQR